MAGGVIAEADLDMIGWNREGDIRAILHATLAVVDVPTLVERDLALVVAGQQRGGNEGVGAVAVRVLQPGAQAGGIPIATATELALEIAGGDRDHRVDIVGDPVALVVVVELDRRTSTGQRDV